VCYECTLQFDNFPLSIGQKINGVTEGLRIEVKVKENVTQEIKINMGAKNS